MNDTKCQLLKGLKKWSTETLWLKIILKKTPSKMLNNNVQKFSMGHSFDDDYFRYFLYTISQSDAPTHQSSVLI